MDKSKDKSKPISRSVIGRLPRYYRFLSDLEARQVERISSGQLAEAMRLTASQIRQDLSCFGGFGQQGYGYNVRVLHHEIGNILGLNHKLPMILLGVGNLGHALARHMDFSNSGFELIGLFDSNPKLVGETVGDLTIRSTDELEAFCGAENPEAAVLCIPHQVAREIAGRLMDCGVKRFWNFSHCDIGLAYPDATVETVHLGDSLMTLRYFLK